MRRALALATRSRGLAQTSWAQNPAWQTLQDARFATEDDATGSTGASSTGQATAGTGRGRGAQQPTRLPGRQQVAPAPGAPQPGPRRQDAAPGPGPERGQRQPQAGRGRAPSKLADNLGLKEADMAPALPLPPRSDRPGPPQQRRRAPRDGPGGRPPHQRMQQGGRDGGRGGSRGRSGPPSFGAPPPRQQQQQQPPQQPQERQQQQGRPHQQPWEHQQQPRQQLGQRGQQPGQGNEQQAGGSPERRGNWQRGDGRRSAARPQPLRFPQQQQRGPMRPPMDGQPPMGSRQGQLQRRFDGGEGRPPQRQRRPSRYDDDDEPSEAELVARRAEYMRFPGNDAVNEAFAEMRKEKEAAADASAVWDSIEVTPETVEALTEEDWAQLKEMDGQLADLEKAGMTVSAKQMARMEEMTAGEGEPPPDPRDVDEWAWDTEEVRDFHRALEMDYEPEYNFSIGTTPRRPTPEERDPAKVLEAFKPALMAQLGIENEEEWAQQAASALDGFDDVLPLLEGRNSQARSCIRNTEEQSLEAMVAAALPADHPMASHVANSLEVVKRNPFWPAAAKQKFVRGMLRDIERG